MSITSDMKEAHTSLAKLHLANAGVKQSRFNVGDNVVAAQDVWDTELNSLLVIANTLGTIEHVWEDGYNVRFGTDQFYAKEHELKPAESVAQFPSKPLTARPMNKDEYTNFHSRCCEKMHDITVAKNADYTGTGNDPFANFTRVEALGICSTEQGFLTRMTDKLSRLASFAERGELSVKDESVEDTLLDLANYCILMAGYLRGKSSAEGALRGKKRD